MLEIITSNAVMIVGILSALVFVAQIIVQVTKELPGIGKLPTKAWVIAVSVLVCVLSLFIYASWANITMLWYYVVLALFAGFVVAYIAMYGWDTLKELWERSKKGE